MSFTKKTSVIVLSGLLLATGALAGQQPLAAGVSKISNAESKFLARPIIRPDGKVFSDKEMETIEANFNAISKDTKSVCYQLDWEKSVTPSDSRPHHLEAGDRVLTVCSFVRHRDYKNDGLNPKRNGDITSNGGVFSKSGAKGKLLDMANVWQGSVSDSQLNPTDKAIIEGATRDNAEAIVDLINGKTAKADYYAKTWAGLDNHAGQDSILNALVGAGDVENHKAGALIKVLHGPIESHDANKNGQWGDSSYGWPFVSYRPSAATLIPLDKDAKDNAPLNITYYMRNGGAGLVDLMGVLRIQPDQLNGKAGDQFSYVQIDTSRSSKDMLSIDFAVVFTIAKRATAFTGK